MRFRKETCLIRCMLAALHCYEDFGIVGLPTGFTCLSDCAVILDSSNDFKIECKKSEGEGVWWVLIFLSFAVIGTSGNLFN